MVGIDTFVILAFFLCFFSGLFDGIAETLKFHPFGFFHVFRKASKNFWDNNISWKNKYKNNDPAQGEKFFLSTGALVSLTDGYHLTRLLRNQFIIFAILVMPTLPLWYMYVVAYILCYLAYTVGFALMYDHILGFKG